MEEPRPVVERTQAFSSPSRITLDPETWFEQLWNGIRLVGLTILISSAEFADTWMGQPWVVGLGILIWGLGFLGRRATDHYFVVDVPARQILEHLRFLDLVRETTYCRWEDVVALGLNPGLRGTFGLVLLRRDGRLLEATSPDDGSLAATRRLGKDLADLLGTRFVESRPDEIPRVEGTADAGVALVYRKRWWAASALGNMASVGEVAVLLGLSFLFGLVLIWRDVSVPLGLLVWLLGVVTLVLLLRRHGR